MKVCALFAEGDTDDLLTAFFSAVIFLSFVLLGVLECDIFRVAARPSL
jgi:hypothetical protein